MNKRNNTPKTSTKAPNIKIQSAGRVQYCSTNGNSRLTDHEVHRISDQLKALSHPVRLQILQFLGEWQSCCCNDFCACIPLAQSTISQHLKILNRAGIIDCTPVGNCSNYSVNQQALEEISKALTLLQELTRQTQNNRPVESRKENPDGRS